MPLRTITKEKAPRKQEIPGLSYHMADTASEADIQRRLDRAFDILFSAVLKTKGYTQSLGQLRTTSDII